jgi:FkbM family methyltransferase
MIGKFKDFIKVFLTVRSPFLAISSAQKGISREAKFRNGDTHHIKGGWNELMSFVNFFWTFPRGRVRGTIAEFPYRGRKISLDFGNLGPVVACEVFEEGGGSYASFFKKQDIEGKIVCDIGASFGDTPVWFALMGAKKVVAVEPVRSFAELSRKNLELNGLGEHAEVIHAAVANVERDDLSSDKNFKVVFEGYEILAKEFEGGKVETVSLSSLVNRYDIHDGILKIDCEGWEYDILLNAPNEVLQRFSRVLIEYHYGFEKLEEHFKKLGFSVRHTPPIAIYVSERPEGYKEMRIGYIYAEYKKI